jgi:hypothetical protein
MAQAAGATRGDDAARACLARFLTEHAAALGYLREVEEALLRREPHMLSLGAAVLARMRLHRWRAQPDDDRLRADLWQWAADCGLRADDAFAYRDEPGYAALAPVLLTLGERDAALTLARRLCQAAERAGRFGDLLGYQVTHALALDAVRRALDLAEPLGAVRSTAAPGERAGPDGGRGLPPGRGRRARRERGQRPLHHARPGHAQ